MGIIVYKKERPTLSSTQLLRNILDTGGRKHSPGPKFTVTYWFMGGYLGMLALLILWARLQVSLARVTLAEKEEQVKRQRAWMPLDFETLLEVLRAAGTPEGQPLTAESWKAQLQTCGYIALEGRAFAYSDLDWPVRNNDLVLAEVTDPMAPWYPIAQGGHYQIIIAMNHARLLIYNIATKQVKELSAKEFLNQWTGKSVLLRSVPGAEATFHWPIPRKHPHPTLTNHRKSTWYARDLQSEEE